MSDYSYIGKNIRNIRRLNKIPLKELQDNLKVTRRTISNIETTENFSSSFIGYILYLTENYDVSFDDIFKKVK